MKSVTTEKSASTKERRNKYDVQGDMYECFVDVTNTHICRPSVKDRILLLQWFRTLGKSPS